MDHFEALRVFLEVARYSSFSIAARNLGYSLATVSRKITQLEEQLNVQLLARTTRSVKLTSAGEVYLAAIRPLLDNLDQIESDLVNADKSLTGTLTLTSPGPFGRRYLVPLIAEFQEQNPEIRVRHILENTRLDYVANGVDIGLRIGPLQDSSLRLSPLGHIQPIYCASASYLEKYGTPASPEDLKHHRTVAYSPRGDRVLWNFTNNQGEDFSVEIDPIYKVDSIDAIVHFVTSGGGIGFFYSFQVAALNPDAQLRPILADFQRKPLPVSYLYPETKHLPARVRKFINFSQPRLKETLIQIENSLQEYKV